MPHRHVRPGSTAVAVVLAALALAGCGRDAASPAPKAATTVPAAPAPAPAVVHDKKVTGLQDCARVLSADDVTGVVGVPAARHVGETPGDCAFDLAVGRPAGSAGSVDSVEVLFGANHAGQDGGPVTELTVGGNPAKQEKKDDDTQQLCYTYVPVGGSGKLSTLIVLVQRSGAAPDVCSTSTRLAELAFSRLPDA